MCRNILRKDVHIGGRVWTEIRDKYREHHSRNKKTVINCRKNSSLHRKAMPCHLAMHIIYITIQNINTQSSSTQNYKITPWEDWGWGVYTQLRNDYIIMVFRDREVNIKRISIRVWGRFSRESGKRRRGETAK